MMEYELDNISLEIQFGSKKNRNIYHAILENLWYVLTKSLKP